MKMIESIIDLNNEAINQYEWGEFYQADDFIVYALSELDSLQKKVQNEVSKESLIQFKCCYIKGWSKSFSFSKEQDGAIMNSRAIVLEANAPKRHLDNPYPISHHLKVLEMVLYYNAAILYHVYSSFTGRHSDVIDTAYYCYENSFLTHAKINQAESSLSFEMKALKSILFHNMGVLYCNNFCRYDDAKKCFRAFQSEVKKLDKRKLVDLGLMTEEEVHQFLHNFLVVPRSVAPAA